MDSLLQKRYLEAFQQSVVGIHPHLSQAAWDYLQSHIEIRSLNKKDYFIKDGQIQRSIGYVAEGLLRGYYIDDKGDEVTIRFVPEGRYATHYSALLRQEASRYYFQCLEQSTLVLLPLEVIQKGYDDYKGLERFGRLIAENILQMQQGRIEQFQFMNAEQRYVQFVEEYPLLFNRVSLSHLSTYLGIQRPSLSRIRKKIAEEG